MQTDNQLTPYGCVYKITNIVNNKCYIGQTTNSPANRWRDYKSLNCKGQPKLYNALKKYGPDKFTYETIDESATDQLVLDTLERQYILTHNCVENGYNCDLGGAGRGKLISEETKRKISEAHKGKKRSVESIMKSAAGHRGHKCSEEAKRKISEAHKGKKRSVESIKKSADSIRGRKHTEEAKRNMSEARKGKKITEETKQKISNALKGRRFSIEHKQKLSESHKRFL